MRFTVWDLLSTQALLAVLHASWACWAVRRLFVARTATPRFLALA